MEKTQEETHLDKIIPPRYQKWLKRLLLVAILLVLVLKTVTYVYEDKVLAQIEKEINLNLVHPMEYSESGLSFFRNFPDITVYFKNLKIKGSNPEVQTPLIELSTLSVQVNLLKNLVGKDIIIDVIRMEDPVMQVNIDKKGVPNYNFLVADKGGLKKILNKLAEEGRSLKIGRLLLEGTTMNVKDHYRDLNLHMAGWDQEASGNFENREIVLQWDTRIREIDMTYKGYTYFNDKVLESEHLTVIRPEGLSVLFRRNDMIFNDLSIDFNGQIDFLEKGMRVDLEMNTAPDDLSNILSALPRRFSEWQREKGIQLSGDATASISVKGESIGETGQRPDLNLTLNWTDGKLLPKGVEDPMEDIQLDMKVVVPGMDPERTRVALDTINFTRGENYMKGHFRVERNSAILQMDGDLAARINLENLSRSLALDSISLKGDLISDITLKGTYDSINKKFPGIRGSMKLQNGYLNTLYYPAPLENIKMEMEVDHDGEDAGKGRIAINEASFDFEGESFRGSVKIEDFADPLFEVKASGVLHPGRLNRVFGREEYDLDGIVKMDVWLRARESLLRNYEIDQVESDGGMVMENITLESPYLPGSVNLRSGAFRFSKGSIKFEKFQGSYARTNFSVNGELRHFLRHLFDKNEKVHGRFIVEADTVYLDDYLPLVEGPSEDKAQEEGEVSGSDSPKTGVLQIPEFVDFTLDYKAGEFIWDKIRVRNLSGLVAVVEGGLFIKNGRMNMIGTSLDLDGVYKNFGTRKAYFDYDIKVSEFDIERAYKEVDMFRTLAPGASNASGIVGLDYELSGVLNENMKVIIPSLEGEGLLTLRDVSVKDHDVLAEVANSTGNKALRDARLQEIGIQTHISNGVIDVDEFEFRIKPFRLRMEGQTNLDQEMNLRMRLGLPPAGLLGIPVKITGTPPDLKIRLGKKTKNLDEDFYMEDGVTDLKMAKYGAFKDSLTADMTIGEIQRMKDRIKKTPASQFKPAGKYPQEVTLFKNEN